MKEKCLMKVRGYSIGMVIICLLILFLSTGCSNENANPNRILKVSLYPYLPNSSELYWKLESEFEKRYPDIELVINLNAYYYDHRPEKGGILYEEADIYEIDCIFLKDFIKKKKIQPLPNSITPSEQELLPMAKIAFQDGKWYGYPHWVCGHFLIYRKSDTKISEVNKLRDLESIIGTNPNIKNGLLIDLKGKSTIGEMYIDALMDEFKAIEKAYKYLNPENINQNIVNSLNRALNLTYKKFGRSDDYHDRSGFYARQFARGNGRAFVGYSEQIHYILFESMHSCTDEENCIKSEEIAIKEWPLSDKGSQPIGWVDIFVIDTKVSGEKLKDAKKFISFMMSNEAYYKVLLPGWYEAPRYLLPAKSNLYSDKKLLEAAPHYSTLFSIIQKAVPLTGENLNSNLRMIGKQLDEELLTD